MRDISLYTKIISLPDSMRAEVNDFVEFLVSKRGIIKKSTKREAGFLKGKIEMSADFDEPINDFKEYMQYFNSFNIKNIISSTA